jgi:predicted dehydrogenase
MSKHKARIAVIGAGWWSQGWHLPCLDRNEEANIVAICDSSATPTSSLDPHLESLAFLQERYKTKIFSSVEDLLIEMGSTLDGVIICTPHATHFAVGKAVIEESERRKMNGQSSKPLHILMEKPMSTDINDAISLYKLVQSHGGDSRFWVNHSANYRTQAKLAREAIGRIGHLRHITGFFASPLKWIFEDASNKGWNEPSPGMLGNGFAWGQSSHLFAWIYHVCPGLTPVEVFCAMTHSENTGADVAHSATIRCKNSKDGESSVVMSVSGTSLLPGNAHSVPPVAKRAQIKIFGSEGSLIFMGDDRDRASGKLELCLPDGSVEILHESFDFENLDNEGLGPESLQNFVQLCCGNYDVYEGADVIVGLRSIQTIEAMYRSHDSHQPAAVQNP